MSRYKQFQPEQIEDYPLQSRVSKVSVESLALPLSEDKISRFLQSLPGTLAARDLRNLVKRIRQARDGKRAIIWGFGGHVIKVGLAPVLIDLMDHGFVTALGTNGSGMIHDFEIAMAGHTSEEVEDQLGSGAFGMARETGELLNGAISRGSVAGIGIGEAVGDLLEGRSEIQYPDLSLFLQAYRREIPISVFLAMGTDTIHTHPSASGAALGEGSLIDFRIFVQQVAQLEGGGVYLNLGSAVLLPEVFLKSVSLVRNSGQSLAKFTTANLDFIQHYRPTRNVVERPVAKGGTGIALTGHHEIMIPLLAAMLVHS